MAIDVVLPRLNSYLILEKNSEREKQQSDEKLKKTDNTIFKRTQNSDCVI